MVPQFISLIFAALSLLFVTGSADAASITKLMKKKKVAVIDAGKGDGIKKGSKVCFFNNNGKKIACGKVGRVRGNKSFVRVPSARFKKLRTGMSAEPTGKGGQTMASKGKGGFDKITFMGLGYYAPSSPSTYERLAFQTVVPGQSSDQAWLTAGPAAEATTVKNFSNLQAEVGFPIGGLGLGLGVRMRTRSFISTSDYDDQPANFVEFKVDESAFGLWATFYFAKINLGGMYMAFGSGLDYDSSSLKVAITKKDDEGGAEVPIFDGTGSLSTLSVTASSYLHIEISDSFGIVGGAKIFIPVSGATSGVEGDAITDEQVVQASTGDPNEDLNTALAYGKSSYAIETTFGFIALF